MKVFSLFPFRCLFQRDLPIGIIGSLLICVILYIGVCLVITGMVPYKFLGEDAPLADAFKSKGLKFVAILISVGAVAGLTTTLLVGLYVQVNHFIPLTWLMYPFHVACANLNDDMFLMTSLDYILGLEEMVYCLQCLLEYTQDAELPFILRCGLVLLLAFWQDCLMCIFSRTSFQLAHW